MLELTHRWTHEELVNDFQERWKAVAQVDEEHADELDAGDKMLYVASKMFTCFDIENISPETVISLAFASNYCDAMARDFRDGVSEFSRPPHR